MTAWTQHGRDIAEPRPAQRPPLRIDPGRPDDHRLERMTNGHIPSSLHRVVNPERPELNRSRHAVVFFAVARPGVLLEGPASLPSPPGMQAHRPIRAGKFLAERMNRVTHRRGGRST